MINWINGSYELLKNEIGILNQIILYQKEQSLSKSINKEISEHEDDLKKLLLEYYLEKRKDFILSVGTIEDYEKWYSYSDYKEEVSSMFNIEEIESKRAVRR